MAPAPAGGSGEEEAGPSNGGKATAGDGDAPPRMGFSLSLASKKPPAAAAALKRPAVALGGDMAPADAPRRELITGVAGGKIASADPSASSRGGAADRRRGPLVIPALENTFRVGGAGAGAEKQAAAAATGEAPPPHPRRYLPEPMAADASKPNEERFESAGPEEAQRQGVSYGLQTMKKKEAKTEAAAEGEEKAAAGAGATAPAAAFDPLAGLSVTSREWEAARYKQDLASLPEEGREEDYERVPVASFARALLRGMGWKEEEDEEEAAKKAGSASAVTRDGRRIDVGVVEFLPRPAGLGLGASLGPSAAAAAAPKKKDRRWETPASSSLPSSSAAAAAAAAAANPPRGTTMVDASGRVRHSRRLGEELRPASEFGGAFAAILRPGARVIVSGGAHSGVSAVVVGAAAAAEEATGAAAAAGAPPSSSASALVRIRLFPSDEEVVVRREHLEEASSSSRGGGAGNGSGGGGDRKRSGGSDDGRRGDRDRRDAARRRPSPPPTKRQRSDSSRSPPPPPPPLRNGAAAAAKWLLPGILVKIVDKGLEGGRFYLKRARVVDVPAPGIATLSVVSSSSLSSASASAAAAAAAEPSASLSGVRASSLETAVPRAPGSAVVVVEGPHRGRRGRLLSRTDGGGGAGGSFSSSSSRGTVQLRGDLEVVQLPLDWFAEAAGGGGEWDGRGGGGGDNDDDDDDE